MTNTKVVLEKGCIKSIDDKCNWNIFMDDDSLMCISKDINDNQIHIMLNPVKGEMTSIIIDRGIARLNNKRRIPKEELDGVLTLSNQMNAIDRYADYMDTKFKNFLLYNGFNYVKNANPNRSYVGTIERYENGYKIRNFEIYTDGEITNIEQAKNNISYNLEDANNSIDISCVVENATFAIVEKEIPSINYYTKKLYTRRPIYKIDLNPTLFNKLSKYL